MPRVEGALSRGHCGSARHSVRIASPSTFGPMPQGHVPSSQPVPGPRVSVRAAGSASRERRRVVRPTRYLGPDQRVPGCCEHAAGRRGRIQRDGRARRDQLGALVQQQSPSSVQHHRRLLLDGLDRYEAHVGTNYRLADFFGSAASFLFVLTKGRTYCGGISRTSWPRPRSSRAH